MCEHNEFDVLLYKDGIMVRKCKVCKEIEIKIEWWLDWGTMQGIMKECNRVIKEVNDA